jgi:hypothetical protein
MVYLDPYPDPDPGGKKRPTKKVNKFHFLSTGCSLLRAEGFYCSSDVLFEGLGISKLLFFEEKKFSALGISLLLF